MIKLVLFIIPNSRTGRNIMANTTDHMSPIDQRIGLKINRSM
jgi:hypothetical protein